MHSSLQLFHPVIGDWFDQTFGLPTPPQERGWPRISAGANVLLLAPTGSGKTLAAFLACIDWLYKHQEQNGPLSPGVRILYVSPLKALNNDIYTNLQEPLSGLTETAAKLGISVPAITTAVRTGDTPGNERQRMLRRPPDILITTPESLFLMVSSKARKILQTVQFVIVDEIHTLFPEKRGAHLAVTLERLEHICGHSPQRIGLSATMRPLDEIGRFLVGPERSVEILDTGSRRNYDLGLALPVKNYRHLPEQSIWPDIYRTVHSLIETHRTTLVFVNNRRLAERLTAKLNDLAGREIARTHHGSISKEMRLSSEGLLKQGKIPCIVATSSLELGIDVGHIDLVIQIESPKEIARGMQRIGRAGHVQHLPSKGRLIPKTTMDLLESTVVMAGMRNAAVEERRAPQACLDILAQQLVAMTTEQDWSPKEMYHVVRGSYPFSSLTWDDFENVLAMLAGVYQSDRYVELKPRLFWDRVNDQVRSDAYGVRLVYSNGGTIPHRGLYGVYLAGQNVRLGELDEEFVHERRLGERFVLGTTVWRIEEMRQDRVVVSRAKDQNANVPFWKGEAMGRSFPLSQEMGRFLREAEGELDQGFTPWLTENWYMEDPDATANLQDLLQRQRRALGTLPHDRQVVVEEFLDEAGQWHMLLHSFFGRKVNMLLGLLLQEQVREEHQLQIEAVASDNGILFHSPGGSAPPAMDLQRLDREQAPRKVAELLRTTSLFGTLFRQNAQRSLVLSLAGFGRKRTPLWLSRLKASDLLQIVQEYPDFPLVKESYRELLQDYFSLEDLDSVLAGLESGEIRVKTVKLQAPSPFAHSHLFEFVGTQMYGDDTPKRSSAKKHLRDNPRILQELLDEGAINVRLDADTLEAILQRLQGFAAFLQQPSLERAQYWLEQIGDVSQDEVPGAIQDYVQPLIERGVASWWDEADTPLLVATVYRELLERGQTKALVQHYFRSRGPASAAFLARRYHRSLEEVEEAIRTWVEAGVLAAVPAGAGQDPEYVAVRVLREVQRRGSRRGREDVHIREASAYIQFLRKWQFAGKVPIELRSEAMATVLGKLAYAWLPMQHLETSILPLRMESYQRADLDAVLAGGLFTWRAEARGRHWVVRFEPAWRQEPEESVPEWIENGGWEETYPGRKRLSTQAKQVLACLKERGAMGLPQLSQVLNTGMTTLFPVLEELMGAGCISNDSLGPLRFLTQFTTAQKKDPRLLAQPKLLAQMGRFHALQPDVAGNAAGQAHQLLDRFGIVSREMAGSETMRWGELYPILDYWETVGRLRRGYFVEGLSGVQFARPEALAALQDANGEESEFWTAVREDPLHSAGLYSLPPGTCVYHGGQPIWSLSRYQLYLHLPDGETDILQAALRHLIRSQYESDPNGKIRIRTVDDKKILDTPWCEKLQEWGFERGYEEMILWPSRRF